MAGRRTRSYRSRSSRSSVREAPKRRSASRRGRSSSKKSDVSVVVVSKSPRRTRSSVAKEGRRSSISRSASLPVEQKESNSDASKLTVVVKKSPKRRSLASKKSSKRSSRRSKRSKSSRSERVCRCSMLNRHDRKNTHIYANPDGKRIFVDNKGKLHKMD